MLFQQTVFDKPPYIYGEGIASITSNAVQVEINNKNVVPEVAIQNTAATYATHYEPRMSPDDPEQMIYIEFTAPNEGDVALVYLKPDDFSLDNKENLTMYTVYLRAATKPTQSEFEKKYSFGVRDWVEPYGFKFNGSPMTKGIYYLGIKPYKGLW